MTRRVLFLLAPFLLVPLLAVAWVRFAKGQGASEKEEQQTGTNLFSAVEQEGDAGANPQHSKAEVPYLPCEDNAFSVWEYGGVGGGDPGKNPELSKTEVLDLKLHFNKGIWDRDPAEIAPCIADGFTKIAERFGIGYMYNKAQFLQAYAEPVGKHLQVNQFVHYTHVLVFGDHNDTALVIGLSKAILHFKGKLSNGPRLVASVYVKQHGRWQAVAWYLADIPKGDAPWNTW